MRSRFNGSKRIRAKSSFEKFYKKAKLSIASINKKDVIKLILIIFLLFFIWNLSQNLYQNHKIENSFNKSIDKFALLNSKSLFSIDNVVLYSSAGATTSEDGNGRINISQFTDISFNVVNIENRKIKSFRIYDINLPKETNSSFSYKNALTFGKFTNYSEEQNSTIEFEVLDSIENIDYSRPYILNNLSNPITLEYINKNLKENFIINSNISTLNFDGRLLKDSGVNLSNLFATISFNVEIQTTNDETHICKVILDIPIKASNSSIYDGNIIKTNVNNIYDFYRIN